MKKEINEIHGQKKKKTINTSAENPFWQIFSWPLISHLSSFIPHLSSFDLSNYSLHNQKPVILLSFPGNGCTQTVYELSLSEIFFSLPSTKTQTDTLMLVGAGKNIALASYTAGDDWFSSSLRVKRGRRRSKRAKW